MQGQSKRKNTGRWEWESAKSVAAHWETLRNWNGSVPSTYPEAKVETGPEGITIDRAIKAFTAEFEEHAAPNTRTKYRLLFVKLRAFADSLGFLVLDQWSRIDGREMPSDLPPPGCVDSRAWPDFEEAIRSLRNTQEISSRCSCSCEGYCPRSDRRRRGRDWPKLRRCGRNPSRSYLLRRGQ
jgi:hypothetical protein